MKSLLFLIISIFSTSLMAQTITCNDVNCSPANIPATVQEKATYSAIDLGHSLAETISVITGTGNTIKDLRMNLSNGEFPGKNLTVNLSSNANGKNAGNIVVIGDNIDTLTVQLNGYNGVRGMDASEICANRILGGLYGNDARVRFLQRRSTPGNGLSNDRCAQVDVDDIATNRFSCNDSAYNSLDTSDPKVNVTRVRQNSKCMAIAPQNVCLQKKYAISCNYKLAVKNTLGIFQMWDEYWRTLKVGTCHTNHCTGHTWCQDQLFLQKNGVDVFRNQSPIYNGDQYYSDHANRINEWYMTEPFQFSKTYYFNQKELNETNTNAQGQSICQYLIDTDPEWNTNSNNYTGRFYSQGRRQYRGCNGYGECSYGCYASSNKGMANDRWFDKTGVKWLAQGNVTPQETSPKLNATLDGLANGTGFSPSPHGNGATRETNYVNNQLVVPPKIGRLPQQPGSWIEGWQLEVMPAFYPLGSANENAPACNPFFTQITTKTENLVKTVFDSNLYTNNSSYCIDINNPVNCSSPPLCDNPSDPTNCRKVSLCAQINKKKCTDPTNSVNCTHPPFCDNSSDPTNCSAAPVTSCEVSGPADNNFCDKDLNNQAEYQFIGTEPDPLKNTETMDCKINNCPATTYKVLASSNFLDTIQPTNGESGTLPGQGLFFVYDIRSLSSASNPGQAGVGGQSDITSQATDRYCGTKRDFTTDPNTSFENAPEVIFKKINWKAFDVKGGGQPGTFPPHSERKVEVYKKIDSSARYLLKKELL